MRIGFFIGIKCCLGLLLGACMPEKGHRAVVSPHDYLDLGAVVASTAHRLEATNQTCYKEIRLGEKVEKIHVQQDSAGWIKAWQRMIHASQELLGGSYQLTYPNPRQLYYTNTSFRTPLQAVKLWLAKEGNEVERLRLFFNYQGYIYSNQSQLWAQLSTRHTPDSLSFQYVKDWGIQGMYKMLGQDTVHYAVHWTCPIKTYPR